VEGVIKCRSQLDQQSALFAAQVCAVMQDEYNKKALCPEQYKEQQEQYAREQIEIFPYIQEVIKKRQATLTSGTMRVWANFLTKYREFEGKSKLSFGEINRAKIEEFTTFIANYKSKKVEKLAANSQKSMIRCFQAVLNEAWKDEIITFNPNHAVEMPKGEQKQKQFLTLPELQTLSNTKCENDTVKRVSLFSALTGLRHSDCVGLRWENITDGENSSIKFTQKKTRGMVYLPISAEARALCGERKNENDTIFVGVHNSNFCNTIISEWVKKAKIKKEITFHCFRHTFATLQLTQGTDIYTVSKMLGHSDVKTTQIYAQLVDEKKQKAANAIKLNINQ
jgi:site-specific recombinase XerD